MKIPSGEPFEGETLIADGWVYRDLPAGVTLDTVAWTAFLSIIGFSNYRILAYTERTDSKGVKWRRGQFLISPKGMANLVAHARRTNPPADENGSNSST